MRASVRFAQTFHGSRTERRSVQSFPTYRDTMARTLPRTPRRPNPRQFEYNPSKTMAMRTSCEEIRLATRYFVALLEISREFEKSNTQSFLPPDFGADLADLTAAFDALSQQLVSHFSTIRRSPVTRQYGPTSMMFQRAEAFVQNWDRFITDLSTISENGVGVYEPQIRETFITLFGMLSTIDTKLKLKGFASRDVIQYLIRSRDELRAIDKKLEEVLATSHQAAIAGLKKKRCVGFLKDHIVNMTVLLDQTLPRDILTPIEIAKMKFDVSVACSTLSQIINAVTAFDEQVRKMEMLTHLLNQELMKIYGILKLPFGTETPSSD